MLRVKGGQNVQYPTAQSTKLEFPHGRSRDNRNRAVGSNGLFGWGEAKERPGKARHTKKGRLNVGQGKEGRRGSGEGRSCPCLKYNLCRCLRIRPGGQERYG